MKRLLAIIFLAIVLFGAYWFFFKKDSHPSEPKQEAIKIKKHSEEFNQSITNVLNEYFNLRNAFADADTIKIKTQVPKFNASVDSIKLDDLKKDDSLILTSVQQQVSDIKANADDILLQKDITEMREDFRMVSENLYPFLRTIAYEGPKLYWQNCPTAFGQDKEGSWLSNSLEIINPYLGKNHPECGELKDSLQ
jgi:flagellar basal body-associated protein FliL